MPGTRELTPRQHGLEETIRRNGTSNAIFGPSRALRGGGRAAHVCKRNNPGSVHTSRPTGQEKTSTGRRPALTGEDYHRRRPTHIAPLCIHLIVSLVIRWLRHAKTFIAYVSRRSILGPCWPCRRGRRGVCGPWLPAPVVSAVWDRTVTCCLPGTPEHGAGPAGKNRPNRPRGGRLDDTVKGLNDDRQ